VATPHSGTAQSAIDPEALERYRRELNGLCYRMLGSAFEAEDAVQETMLRAMRAAQTFEGRSSLRSWLYRIATNVCTDMLRGRARRASPIGLGPSSAPEPTALGPRLPEGMWVSPACDTRVLSDYADPAELAAARESIRLAFVTALQHLPARQRAALVLCKVLGFEAAEVAVILGTTVAAVNSAVQRAGAALAALPPQDRVAEVHSDHADLLARYIEAFERYDIPALVKLLHDDAVQTMPPYAMWLRGAADIGGWMLGAGIGCRGSRLLAARANGCPAFGQYRIDVQGGYAPFALHVLEICGGRVASVHVFLDTERIFPHFALPARIPA